MNLRMHETQNADFSSLYDSIVGEEGAYNRLIEFFGTLVNSVAGGGYYRGYLPNNQISEFYNFRVNYTMPRDVLDDLLSTLYFDGDSLTKGTKYKQLLEKFSRIFKTGNIVSIRLDTPFMKHNERLSSGEEFNFSQFDVDSIRGNHLYFLIANYLVQEGILSPLNEKCPSCTFDTTEFGIFDLIYLLHQDMNEEALKRNPANIGFKNYAKISLPRFVSYRALEPEIVQNPLGEAIKKYRERGTAPYFLYKKTTRYSWWILFNNI